MINLATVTKEMLYELIKSDNYYDWFTKISLNDLENRFCYFQRFEVKQFLDHLEYTRQLTNFYVWFSKEKNKR